MALTPVTVSIPEEHIPALYRFVAELCDTEADGSWDDEADEGFVTNGKAKAGFGRHTVRKSYLGGVSNVWRPMLEHLADNAGEWVTWPDLCAAVDRTPKQMAGALGAAERRVNNKPPYEKSWDNGVRVFRMNETVAEFIHELVEEHA